MSEPPETLRAALSGRYELERELGRGGMATVYLARGLRHDRQVALKVLRPELTPVAVVGGFAFAQLSAGEYSTCGRTVGAAAYVGATTSMASWGMARPR